MPTTYNMLWITALFSVSKSPEVFDSQYLSVFFWGEQLFAIKDEFSGSSDLGMELFLYHVVCVQPISCAVHSMALEVLLCLLNAWPISGPVVLVQHQTCGNLHIFEYHLLQMIDSKFLHIFNTNCCWKHSKIMHFFVFFSAMSCFY